MTEFRNIQRIRVEFINRDGIPTALEVKDPEEAYCRMELVDDNMDVTVFSIMPNSTEHYNFVGMEDEGWVPKVVEVAAPTTKSELGPVGRWSLGIVGLAILAPFVAILWAWAGGVFRSLS